VVDPASNTAAARRLASRGANRRFSPDLPGIISRPTLARALTVTDNARASIGRLEGMKGLLLRRCHCRE